MTDTPVTPIPVDTTPVTSAPTVTETPVVAPVAETPVQAIETVTPTPVAETPVETTPAAETPPSDTFLGEDKKDSTPVETNPAEQTAQTETPEVKPEEGGQTDEPAPPPTYETFTLPEDVKLDEARVSEFTSMLGELELKAKGSMDHAAFQEFGQKMVDLYINESDKLVKDITKLYQDSFERQKVEWKDQFLKDPEIGGNRFQTTVDAARQFISTHGGTPDQQKELREVLNLSGLGNHPSIIRLLANANRVHSEGKPLTTVRPETPSKSKTQTLYGKL